VQVLIFVVEVKSDFVGIIISKL